MIDSRPDGVAFGATEVLAFTLQRKALGQEIDFESLDTPERAALGSIVKGFGESIGDARLQSLKKFCGEISQEINVPEVEVAQEASVDKSKGFLKKGSGHIH